MTDLYLAGYPDDQGIRLNNGRPGAALAPAEIRKHLKKMTQALFHTPRHQEVHDLGDLPNHETVQIKVQEALSKGAHWVGLGGGHDYGYPDAKAFIKDCQKRKERPLVINFDAHLDVRPLDHGITSGTPFFRLLSEEQDLDFFEIGIQSHCNSKEHIQWAKNHGARILSYEEILVANTAASTSILKFIDEFLLKPRPCMVSLDIDVFSSAWAPGASASYPMGLEPNDMARVLDVLFQRLDVRVFSIYEVSPPLDVDNRTSKLAAQLLHRFL